MAPMDLRGIRSEPDRCDIANKPSYGDKTVRRLTQNLWRRAFGAGPVNLPVACAALAPFGVSPGDKTILTSNDWSEINGCITFKRL